MSTQAGEEGLEFGARAANQLLDSGHLVVTVFMFNTFLLLVVIVWLFRMYHNERKENTRLINELIEVKTKMLNAIREWRKQIEDFMRVLFDNGDNR